MFIHLLWSGLFVSSIDVLDSPCLLPTQGWYGVVTAPSRWNCALASRGLKQALRGLRLHSFFGDRVRAWQFRLSPGTGFRVLGFSPGPKTLNLKTLNPKPLNP